MHFKMPRSTFDSIATSNYKRKIKKKKDVLHIKCITKAFSHIGWPVMASVVTNNREITTKACLVIYFTWYFFKLLPLQAIQ